MVYSDYKRYSMNKLVSTCLLIFCFVFVKAQDVHYSLYELAPVQMNAAQAGQFDGEYRISSNYRSQWFDVPVAYRTFSVAFDMQLLPYKLDKDRWGASALFLYDQAGDGQLSNLNIQLSTSYAKHIFENVYVGAGFQLGYGYRRFKLDQFTFNDQFNGDVFDPTIQSYDQIKLAGNNTLHYLDLSTGLLIEYRKNERQRARITAGLHHLNRPNQSFLGDDIPQFMRFSLLADGSIPISQKIDVLPVFWMQWQGPHREFVFGGGARYHISQELGKEMSIQTSALYRLNDAVIWRLAFQYNQFTVGLSYDINISGFVPATRYNGGYELSLLYVWAKVPRLPLTKNCPVF